MDIRLDGKVAIVTGSGQGIGRAAAELLARCGAAVVVNGYRRPEELETVAQGIRDAGGKAVAVVADVTDRQQAQKTVDAALDLGGSVDILVNNAGGLVKRVPVSDFDEEHFDRVMAINVKSAFLMSHLVLPHMKKKNSGWIVNLASQAAHDGGGPGAAAYAASKGAIWTFTKSLAKEVAPFNIRVNAVSPGFIAHTAFHDTFTPKEVQEKIVQNIPLGRAGSSEDVARVILFLASDLAEFMTGQIVEVNGGTYMP